MNPGIEKLSEYAQEFLNGAEKWHELFTPDELRVRLQKAIAKYREGMRQWYELEETKAGIRQWLNEVKPKEDATP